MELKLPPNYYYSYGLSCDYESFVQIKIGTLEGKRESPTHRELLRDPILKYAGRNETCSDLYVECIVVNGNGDETLPVRTLYKPFIARWNWNEWLELPIQFSVLDRSAKLLLTIYDYGGPGILVPVGGTSISLFRKNGLFRQGLIDLRVWPGVKAHISDTPGKGALADNRNDQMYRLNKLVKKHERGQISRIDWLDRLTFREIEVINDKEKRTSKFMYLMVEFPKILHEGKPIDLLFWELGVKETSQFEKKRKFPLFDPDRGVDNLFERKHHFLTRSLRSGITDKDQRPNSAIRDVLFRVMEYPHNKQLTTYEQDLIWKYRFYLSSHKKALTKFLKCVNWELEGEFKQAVDMLKRWVPLDPHDALELLSPAYKCSEVRQYAVDRLSHASDEDLQLYLLQLVQALRYECLDLNEMNFLDVSHYSLETDLSNEAETKLAIGLPLLKDEGIKTAQESGHVSSLLSSTETENRALSESANISQPADDQTALLLDQAIGKAESGLAAFLIKRASQNPSLANYFYWYLHVECEEKDAELGTKAESKVKDVYAFIMKLFRIALQRGDAVSRSTWHTITRQQNFLDNLVSIITIVKNESGSRLKKIEKLRTLIANAEAVGGTCLTHFEPLALPLRPEVKVVGLIPEKATLFKSAKDPCKLTFRTSTGSEFVAIFKHGDDLRQDQLVIGMIMLIDTLLQNENLDLKLTPYRVIATSHKHGFVEYIDSVPLSEITNKEGGIYGFLRKNAPCDSSPLGIAKDAMNNYTKSLAGYSVITYLLGIGDRHLDNLLITKRGKLFHVDFGYILGRDPKLLPPPIKLTKEMVEAMGGQSSLQYKEFCRLCYTAFHQLRRHANLILNLFSLMVDASVPDIMLEPDMVVKKIEDRLCLSLSDEEVATHMQEVVDSSLNAVFAVVNEHFHEFAQYMRK